MLNSVSVASFTLFRHVISAEMASGRPASCQHILQVFEEDFFENACAAAAVALSLGADVNLQRFVDCGLRDRIDTVVIPAESVDISSFLAARAAVVAARAEAVAAHKALEAALDAACYDDDDPAVVAAEAANASVQKKTRAARQNLLAAAAALNIHEAALHIYDGAGDII